jgi:hypothetical protein
VRVGQLVIVAVVAWLVARALRGQWSDLRRASAQLDADWSLVALSSALVLTAYAVLIEVWRRLARGGAPVAYHRAARIWFVSSLGKYVPGKLWAIGAMGAMARREGVPATAAAGAAILNQAVNVAAGFAVLAASGAGVLPLIYPVGASAALVVAAVSVAGLLALPLVLPRLLDRIGRQTGRWGGAVIPASALWLSIVGNLAAWVLYGVAFHVFVRAVLGAAPVSWASSVAVFTGSYLAGYLALFAPGGLVVREAAVVAALTGIGAATLPQSTLVAVASRLWLTLLEVAPGAAFLLRDALTRSSRSNR